jgi:hypothetical protein
MHEVIDSLLPFRDDDETLTCSPQALNSKYTKSQDAPDIQDHASQHENLEDEVDVRDCKQQIMASRFLGRLKRQDEKKSNCESTHQDCLENCLGTTEGDMQHEHPEIKRSIKKRVIVRSCDDLDDLEAACLDDDDDDDDGLKNSDARDDDEGYWDEEDEYAQEFIEQGIYIVIFKCLIWRKVG